MADWSQRQQENQQQVKAFLQTKYNNTADWIFKTIKNTKNSVITPYDNKKTVLIPKDLLVLGNIIGHVINPSDKNLKENIEKIDSADLNKLNPVSFTFKADNKNKKHFN